MFYQRKTVCFKGNGMVYMKTVSTDSPMPQIEENITEAYWFQWKK